MNTRIQKRIQVRLGTCLHLWVLNKRGVPSPLPPIAGLTLPPQLLSSEEPVFLNVYEAQKSITRNELRQPP